MPPRGQTESPFVVRRGSGPRPPHWFIVCIDAKPQRSEVSAPVAYVLNHLLRARWSASRYRKAGVVEIPWTHAKGGAHRTRVTFPGLLEHIERERGLKSSLLALPPIECSWLDHTFAFAEPDAPIARADGIEFAVCGDA